jgi:tyrosyl-tRNA synthetase
MLPLRTELEARWLLKQYSNEALFDLYDKGWQTFYIGMDPSADSLTIGNFAMFMTCVQFLKRGNTLIFIVGGETGMIGDPGGKDSERNMQTLEQLDKNYKSIHAQVQFVMANVLEIAWIQCDWILKNNHDFYETMTFSDFLRTVGKNITINNMIKKETVAKRIEDPDKSISYTEFSYMLIQWYDFVRLYEDFGCKLQICGSDQWGNGVTGLELIGKMLDKDDAYVMTSPLILDSNGKKFGKSEGNAVWLSPEKNSPYFVYQFWMNVADADVSRFLKVYSLLDLEEIENIQKKHDEAPELRYGQKELAYRVCQIIFGTKAAETAKEVSVFMFSNDKLELLRNADEATKMAIAKEVGALDLGLLRSDRNDGSDVTIIDALVESGLCESRGDAKKMIEQWAVSLDEQVIKDVSLIIPNGSLLLQKGKKNMRIIL